MNEFTYEIGGKKYTQKKLVLGQLQQLLGLLPGLRFGSTEPLAVMAALGDKLPQALAVVLIPEGVALKDKDLPALAGEIAFAVEPETAMQVVEDFFTCTPVPSLLERLTAMADTIRAALNRANGSGSSSSSSPEGTSSNATPSSGDTG